MITLNNGQRVEISVTFSKLAELRKKNKTAYDEYNRVIMHGTNDVFDYAAVIYAGYCCNEEEPMGYKAFMDQLPTDINDLVDAFNSIVAPKKKEPLSVNSKEKQEA